MSPMSTKQTKATHLDIEKFFFMTLFPPFL